MAVFLKMFTTVLSFLTVVREEHKIGREMEGGASYGNGRWRGALEIYELGVPFVRLLERK